MPFRSSRTYGSLLQELSTIRGRAHLSSKTLGIIGLLGSLSFTLPLHGQGKPLELSAGWSYSASSQGDGYAQLNGYYGTLTLDVTKTLGLSFSQSTAWGTYHGEGVTQRLYLLGVTQSFGKSDARLRPFVQPLFGVTRASYLKTVENQPTFQITVGAELHLTSKLCLELTPLGYSYNHSSVGALNNFVSGVGLNFPLTAIRRHR